MQTEIESIKNRCKYIIPENIERSFISKRHIYFQERPDQNLQSIFSNHQYKQVLYKLVRGEELDRKDMRII